MTDLSLLEGFGALACVIVLGGLATWFFRLFVSTIDGAFNRRMHERLGERHLASACRLGPDHPEYKARLTLARAHLHKAGYDNGYSPGEWSDLYKPSEEDREPAVAP
jgi:hypothetical protein